MSAWRLRGLRSRCPRSPERKRERQPEPLPTALRTQCGHPGSLERHPARRSRLRRRRRGRLCAEPGAAGSRLCDGRDDAPRHGLGDRPVDRQPARHGRHCDSALRPSDPHDRARLVARCAYRRRDDTGTRRQVRRRRSHVRRSGRHGCALEQQARWGFRRANPARTVGSDASGHRHSRGLRRRRGRRG